MLINNKIEIIGKPIFSKVSSIVENTIQMCMGGGCKSLSKSLARVYSNLKTILFGLLISLLAMQCGGGGGSSGGGSSGGDNPTPSVEKPVITVQPTSQSVVAPATATFTVVVTGTSLSYQWKKDGTNVTTGVGGTTNTYTTPATVFGDDGAVFTVVVSNSLGSVTSSSATLTVSGRYSLVVNASGGFYDKTECVKDNTTGLVWEGKTLTGTRAASLTYTNYDSTSSAQKSDNTNPTQAEIDASTNSIGYRNSVRTSNLCGYNDWRMPTKDELLGIVASSGSPKIDTTWFPNTRAAAYWSSSPYDGFPNYAWYVFFVNGLPFNYYRNDGFTLFHVRLVR